MRTLKFDQIHSFVLKEKTTKFDADQEPSLLKEKLPFFNPKQLPCRINAFAKFQENL